MQKCVPRYFYAQKGVGMVNFENLDKYIFPGVGKYGIPQIHGVTTQPRGEFIPMNYAMTERCPEEKNLHCFVDDYQFTRWWNSPDRYIPKLSKFRAVCSPDFSVYTDMPRAMQIYNHYRRHWLAAYWQIHGLVVYPTVAWSDEHSYEWCFDGEPTNSVVAVSSVGVQRDAEARRLFLRGYEEMMARLTPTLVLFYGDPPKECGGNILRIAPHYEKIRRRCKKQ